MIVVDTSALMAVLKGEPESDDCISILAGDPQLLVSAGTLAEALIVSHSRGIGQQMLALFERFGIDVVAATALSAHEISNAYLRWGKGYHRAKLNFGDCFAYALAMRQKCPLLFIGDDFSLTDVIPALPKR